MMMMAMMRIGRGRETGLATMHILLLLTIFLQQAWSWVPLTGRRQQQQWNKESRNRPQRIQEEFVTHHHSPTFLQATLSNNPEVASMKTALAVVPPDEAWDTLQRARHYARDRSYTKWPPCIRLFHPLYVNSPLDIAQIVEKYNIEPFQVKLNQWSVIPHAEAMEADWMAMQQDRSTEDASNEEESSSTSSLKEIDELIAREERIGRRNCQKRLERQRARGLRVQSTQPAPEEPEEDSPKALLEKQKRMYEEFNGPCVVCLEPDEESKERLMELREILRQELFEEYAKYSPTSSVSTTDTLPKAASSSSSDYRPLVPIGSFPTVTSAIEMARQLRGLWDPLSWNVTDLQLISCQQQQASSSLDDDDDSYYLSELAAVDDNIEYAITHHKTSWLSHAQDEEQHLSSNGQFGCDAMIMLMGEEVEMDDELNQEMTDLICQRGQAGGYERSFESISQETIVEYGMEEDDTEELEQWLLEDDDFDEGTVVVIGRTHFFTGEMRIYVGMPATSVMDGKDRVLGDGVSGAARRRGSVHRSGSRFEGCEWGHKESDFLPWSKMERANFLSNALTNSSE